MLLQLVTLSLVALAAGQGGPPGVPPRQGHAPPQQQPPPQQQQQHQQQQQQQFQQQQMNVQEGQAHGHGHGHGQGGNKLRFQSEIHNADHIMEHLQNVIKTKPKEDMSEEELEFHYFKMHDYDNNNKLDGVEIGKALTHFHDDDHHEPNSETGEATSTPSPPPPSDTSAGNDNPPPKAENTATVKPNHTPYSDEVIASLVDMVLNNYDKDEDGYVEYFEYRKYKEMD